MNCLKKINFPKHNFINYSFLSESKSGVPYTKFNEENFTLNNKLPKYADAVIIGGGVSGCSTLYHLSKFGITNCVLLEKNQLTSGTTWHTAGLVWSLRPTDLDIELLRRSRCLMTEIENETGISSGWIQNGGIFIASTKERLDEYKRLMTLGKAFGIKSYILSPEETKKLYPLMNVTDIYGTLYSPEDGTVDPAGYCTALTKASIKRGAQIIQNCPVIGIELTNNHKFRKSVHSVQTIYGNIKTNIVVNCSGAWSPLVGKMCGVEVPLMAMEHAYVVTESINGIQNMPNIRDHDSSVYIKLQGESLSVGGYEPNPTYWPINENHPSFSLFELNWDVFSFNIKGSINRVPIIESTGIKSTVCGPESFTADHKALIGESPEVRGFYLGCGFNSSGMMLSAGCGEELAKWIINGKPDLDMYSYDIRRFDNNLVKNDKDWLKERCHESYAKNYSIVYPKDEPLSGRLRKKDVLFDILAESGCVYQERNGWERPGWFKSNQHALPKKYDYYGYYGHQLNKNYEYLDSLKLDYTFEFPNHLKYIKMECIGCRERVAIFNMSYFGKFYLSGRDAEKAVDYIFTNDMKKPQSSTIYTCMLNKRGGVEADLTVSILNNDFQLDNLDDVKDSKYYIAIGGGITQHGFSYIQDIIEDEKFDCKLIDKSQEMAMLSIQGPRSRDLLEIVTNSSLSNVDFPFSTSKIMKIAQRTVFVIRLSFVGELGWEIHMSNKVALDVYNEIMKVGNKFGIINAGYRAIDSLSIEKGYRHWHMDLRSDDTPLESNLSFVCKLSQDVEFIGKKSLLAQKNNLLRKKIACFTLDENIPLNGLELILRNNECVGFIRRGDFAFTLNKSIGYGYISDKDNLPISKQYLKDGNYSIEVMGQKIPASIHFSSPFDPENKRIKGIYS